MADGRQRPEAGELARRVGIETLGDRPRRIVVEADAAERRAIAGRLGVPSVEALAVTFELRRLAEGVFAAQGVLRAAVERECVVTLEPFVERIEEAFEVEFVPAGREGDGEGDGAEISVDPALPDRIPYAGTRIDLGEAAVEQLALALDPFPRRPGARLDDAGGGDPADAGAEAERTHPFAGLASRLRGD